MGLSLLLLAGIERERFAHWLGFALAAALVLAVAEGVTGLLSVEERAAVEARSLVSGWAAPLFWFQILVGLIVPLALLRSKGMGAWAGGLAMLGVLAEKSWLLAVGQSLPWLPLQSGSYLPGWLEVVAVIGVAGIGMLAYVLMRRWLR